MAEWTEARTEDRLPWLETAEDNFDDRPSAGRVILMVVLGLAVIAAILFGMYLYEHRTVAGDGNLIAAQPGDYKVRPTDPGGLKVEGEGDSAIATSGGETGNSSIDLTGMPETPVTGTKAKPTTIAGASKVAVTSDARKLPDVGTATPGSLVQLGSYPSEAEANKQWARLSGRFSYVAPLAKLVQKAAVNGRTWFRLRVNAGGANAAQELCGKLKVAGETCFVTS